jgi:UDP-N-acetylglucosamine 2-epimerase (non-hydrolysing)
MKILFIFGTRPEAIKMAPVIELMAHQPEVFDLRVCVTAQHRQMLDQVLGLFNIEPDYDLNLMQEGQTLSEITSEALSALTSAVLREQPDWVVVQGDTTTAMAAGMVAYYHQVKLAHIEAGLRTYDKFQPFPEEINRRIITDVADMHFAPTQRAKENLLAEGVNGKIVHVTGNTVIDALLWVLQLEYRFNSGALARIPFDKRVILVTAHRRENFGRPLKDICHAIKMIVGDYSGSVHVVYPVHLNPNIWKPVHSLLGDVPNVTLLKPLDYLSFVQLMSRSYLVMSDSGGLQEEAPSLNKPILVLRNLSERPEGIEAGTAKIVGTDSDCIVREVRHLLDNQQAYDEMANALSPYGDGHAAERICDALLATANKRAAYIC